MNSTTCMTTAPRRWRLSMSNTYTVEAVKRTFLRSTIEADSLEEAQRIADEDDFDEIDTDFTLTFVA